MTCEYEYWIMEIIGAACERIERSWVSTCYELVVENCLRYENDVVVFFFSSIRRHTILQGDLSSDVCSSNLDRARPLPAHQHSRLPLDAGLRPPAPALAVVLSGAYRTTRGPHPRRSSAISLRARHPRKIGRA